MKNCTAWRIQNVNKKDSFDILLFYFPLVLNWTVLVPITFRPLNKTENFTMFCVSIGIMITYYWFWYGVIIVYQFHKGKIQQVLIQWYLYLRHIGFSPLVIRYHIFVASEACNNNIIQFWSLTITKVQK